MGRKKLTYEEYIEQLKEKGFGIGIDLQKNIKEGIQSHGYHLETCL